MRNIGIIGFGVLGKQILNFLKEFKEPDKVIVFDDFFEKNSDVDGVFPLSKFQDNDFSAFDFYIGLGYKHLHYRLEIIDQLKSKKRNLPSLVHPSCYLSPLSIIGNACILFPKCNLDQNVTIGNGNVFHNSVVISHDTSIGDSNYVSPSVTICGNVKIGNEIFIGAGSIISNNVVIQSASQVGIGSCITKNVEANSSVIGNPQKLLNKQINLL